MPPRLDSNAFSRNRTVVLARPAAIRFMSPNRTFAVGWRHIVIAVAASVVLSGCAATAPTTRSLPLATHVRVLETGIGAGPPDTTSDPGQFRYIFLAQRGVTASRLMIREVDRLRAAGWTLSETRSGTSLGYAPVGTPHSLSELHSSALGVDLQMVATLSDAEGLSEGDTGLSITPAVNRALRRHDGILFATFSSAKLQ